MRSAAQDRLCPNCGRLDGRPAPFLREEADVPGPGDPYLCGSCGKPFLVTADPVAATCEHLDFEAHVEVNRIVEHLAPEDEGRAPTSGDDPYAFRAVVHVACARCHASFGRDSWDGHRKQWFGPFGVGVERHEVTLRFWLPTFSWAWGYWR